MESVAGVGVVALVGDQKALLLEDRGGPDEQARGEGQDYADGAVDWWPVRRYGGIRVSAGEEQR